VLVRYVTFFVVVIELLVALLFLVALGLGLVYGRGGGRRQEKKKKGEAGVMRRAERRKQLCVRWCVCGGACTCAVVRK
jgi:hypothetical protein